MYDRAMQAIYALALDPVSAASAEIAEQTKEYVHGFLVTQGLTLSAEKNAYYKR